MQSQKYLYLRSYWCLLWHHHIYLFTILTSFKVVPTTKCSSHLSLLLLVAEALSSGDVLIFPLLSTFIFLVYLHLRITVLGTPALIFNHTPHIVTPPCSLRYKEKHGAINYLILLHKSLLQYFYFFLDTPTVRPRRPVVLVCWPLTRRPQKCRNPRWARIFFMRSRSSRSLVSKLLDIT